MKTKTIASLVLTAAALTARADLPVIDPALLAQALEQMQITLGQLRQITTEVERLGNPATYRPAGANAAIQSLNALGVGKTWSELRNLASGQAAMTDVGGGLYRAVGQAITTSTGLQYSRPADDFRKFDAITEATSTLEAVLKDTEVRRQKARDDIKATTEQLRVAQTVAEIQKLQGVLAAQAADLGSIDRERDAALNRVLIQKIENENDVAKQAQARQENRVVDFQSSQQTMGQFLTPNTNPVRIPDPRNP